MSTSIILFSHGSVLCGAGESLAAMARELERLSGCNVGIGYLNYSEPSFADAVDVAVANNADEIIIVPYFLVAGYFVQQKLPPLIDAARQRHPQISFRVAEAICAHPLMRNIVLACAGRTQTIDQWRVWWRVAPEFCRSDMACPLYDTALCAVHDANHASNDADIKNLPNPLYKGELCSGVSAPLNDRSLTSFNNRSLTSFNNRSLSGAEGKGDLSSNTALLILVHGSPQEESNLDMYEVVEQVRAVQKYFYIQVGFMECNEPSIPRAIEKCVDAGANRIIAVPYFLHAGRHVADDLPGYLEKASAQYPDVEFLLGDYLGQELSLAKVLLALGTSAKI